VKIDGINHELLTTLQTTGRANTPGSHLRLDANSGAVGKLEIGLLIGTCPANSAGAHPRPSHTVRKLVRCSGPAFPTLDKFPPPLGSRIFQHLPVTLLHGAIPPSDGASIGIIDRGLLFNRHPRTPTSRSRKKKQVQLPFVALRSYP
jgi:hypothetical protein